MVWVLLNPDRARFNYLLCLIHYKTYFLSRFRYVHNQIVSKKPLRKANLIDTKINLEKLVDNHFQSRLRVACILSLDHSMRNAEDEFQNDYYLMIVLNQLRWLYLVYLINRILNCGKCDCFPNARRYQYLV